MSHPVTRRRSRQVFSAASATLLVTSLITALGTAIGAGAAHATSFAEPIGAPAANATSCTPAGQEATNTDLHLFSINDFHGRLNNNTVQFAGVVEGLKAKYGEPNSVVLSSGDNIGASLFTSSLQYDAPTIAVLNALGVSAAAMGNHEFDKGFYPGSGQTGLDFTTRILKGETTGVGADHPAVKANFQYLAANAYKAGTKEQIVPGHTIVVKDGIRIAVIGAVTEETPNLVSKGALAGIEFGDPVTAVNEEVAKIKAAGTADVYVADYHEGAGAGTKDGVTLDEEIAASPAFGEIVTKTDPAVSAIFTAHTHKLYAWDAPNGATTRPILQTQSYGAYVGNVCLSVNRDTKAVTGHWAENVAVPATPKDANAAAAADAAITSAYPAAATVKTIVDDATAVAKVAGEKVVGKVLADVTRPSEGGTFAADGTYSAPGYGNRAMGSALGNLVTTALQAQLQPAGAEPIITLANPGGIRDDLRFGENGDVTFAAANSILPFLNNLWTLNLTGVQIKTVLEQQWQTGKDGTPTGSYLQLAMSNNLKYTYDPSKPQGQRIVQVWANGKPLDPAKNYLVGTFNFLAQGGDNFWEFQKATNVKDTGLIDRDAWMAYFDKTKTVGIAPDFTQRAYAVKAAVPATAKQGETVTFDIADLQMRSAGSKLATSVDVMLGGVKVATVPATASALASGVAPGNPANTATVSFKVPMTAAAGATTLMLTANPTGSTIAFPFTVVAVPKPVTVYKYPFSDALYVVEGTGAATRARQLTFDEWVKLGTPAPVAAPVAYVKYPWAPDIYAVTFWNQAPASWVWTHLNGAQWAAAKYPAPVNAGWITGTTLKKFGTNDELFATLGGTTHKLSFAEWQAMNYAGFSNLSNQGYVKFPWSNNIYWVNDLAGVKGSQITFAQWVSAAGPTPRTLTNAPGSRLHRSASNPAVTFDAPTLGILGMPVSFDGWKAAGFPPVSVD